MSTYKTSIWVLVVLNFSVYALLSAQDKLSIAVLPLQGNGISETEALVLTDELSAVLVKSRKYIVVERNNMESILSEQGFQLSGCTSAECAVEAGKLLGVKKMVTGSIGKLGELYNINLRLFDVGTGRIDKTVSQKHEGSVEELLDVINKLGNELSMPGDLAPGQDSTTKYDPSADQTTEFQDAVGRQRNRFGIWIGLNFPRTSNISQAGKGLCAGAFYKVNLVQYLFIQPEISYASAELEYFEPQDILRFEFLHTALLFSYEISSTNIKDFFINLTAGPALTTVLGAEQEYEGYVSDIKSDVRSSMTSVIVGIGLGMRLDKLIVMIDARFERGLNTIFNNDVEWEVGKSQAFSFNAGVSF